MDLKDKLGICKVVAQAILADAAVTDQERAFLEKLMDRYGLDKAQRREALARNLGDDAAALAAKVGVEARQDLLLELACAVVTDGVLQAEEEQILRRVGASFGVSEEEMESLIADAVSGTA